MSFEWPCEKRTAHGPHERLCFITRPAVFDKHDQGYQSGQRVYVVGPGRMTTEKDCPGVKAHPNTMIGRVT